MKDIWGSELHVGDEVALKAPDLLYSYFVRGEVIGFTPCKVRVTYWNHNGVYSCLKDPGGVAKRFGDKP